MSAHDKRVVDAVGRAVPVVVGRIRGPLVEAIGGPAAWVWDEVAPDLSRIIAAGVLDVLGEIGIETGRIKVAAEPGAGVSFELLPPLE